MWLLLLLVAAAAAAGLGAAAQPPGIDYPHIPWLAVQVASTMAAPIQADCHSASATFLLMLLQAKHNNKEHTKAILDELSGGSEGCASQLGVSVDENRWPRTLVTVACSCEGRRCRLLGTYHCATLLGSVPVLLRLPGGTTAATSQVLPVGCHCLERPSKRAQHHVPHHQEKRTLW